MVIVVCIVLFNEVVEIGFLLVVVYIVFLLIGYVVKNGKMFCFVLV